MTASHRDALLVALLWSIGIAVALALRPPISPDETRYLAVAWDMWTRGDFLVPHLNGSPYSDKAPLLFWLFHLGWAVGGVSQVWPRLIGPLCALGSAFLLIPIARRLWPDRSEAGWAAMVALPGTLGWIVYGSFVLFDMLLTACVLLALLGVLEAWRDHAKRGWLLCGLGVGLGLLAKGPAALLHILPVPLLAPWWMRDTRPQRWGGWYAGLGLAILIGAAIALAWAVPAGAAGGQGYHDAIFLRQTTSRLMSGAAHGRPIWWYLPIIPLLLLPWCLWPPAWRALASVRRQVTDSGVRLCLGWLSVTFLAFSLTSGKQAHYLIPLIPALALLWDAGWAARRDAGDGRGLVGPAALLALAGLSTGLAPHLLAIERQYPGIRNAPLWPAILLLAAAGAVIVLGRRVNSARIPLLVTASGLTLTSPLYFAVMPALRPNFDVAPVALELRTYQEQGFAIAHVGKYNAQWHFAGRMTEPFTVVPNLKAARRWMVEHPRHVLIHYARSAEGPTLTAAGERCSPFRDRLVCLAVADPGQRP